MIALCRQTEPQHDTTHDTTHGTTGLLTLDFVVGLDRIQPVPSQLSVLLTFIWRLLLFSIPIGFVTDSVLTTVASEALSNLSRVQ